jgi:hypothetical protein
MTDGNERGRPLTQTQPTSPNQTGPGSESGNDWNRDQQGQALDREDQVKQKPSGLPDDSPMQDDEDGAGTTTRGAGTEGTTRY